MKEPFRLMLLFLVQHRSFSYLRVSQVATRLVERRGRSDLGVANAILLLLEEDPYQQDVCGSGRPKVQQTQRASEEVIGVSQ